MEAINLFRLLAVTSGGSSTLKLSCSSLLPHSFLTSELPISMELSMNLVTYSNHKFCRSVGPDFATLGTSR